MINKDTELYFSVSSKPGNLGATVYNELFAYHKINAIYKPLKAKTDQEFISILRSARCIGASGLSVSMPFKYLARHMVDPGDNTAAKSGNANTISLNADKSYNTDMDGVAMASGVNSYGGVTCVVVGDGAMANSISASLSWENKAMLVGRKHHYLLNEPVFFHGMGRYKFLFNATPIGMDDIPDEIFTPQNTKHYDKIIDCAPKYNTNLRKCAEQNEIKFVSGIDIFAHQVRKQFYIYTGIDIELKQIVDILDKNGFYK